MNKELSLAILACIFFSHSAKPVTTQRPDSNQPAESIIIRKEHKTGKKQTTHAQESTTKFVLLDPKAPTITSQPFTEPVFANRFNKQKNKINLFITKIDFTRDGVSLFLNQTFNNRDYGSEFLPYSLSHLTQFLDFAHANKQSPEFIEGALRLFNQKIKNAPFLTAASLERFLDKVHPHFEAHLAVTPFSLWQESKHLLSQAFREKFSFAQQDPLGFFEYVSKNLAHEVQINMITPERVRATCMRFLSCTTDKIIWAPSDQAETWRSFKKIGNHFHTLHLKKVIPDEFDANELYWSLIERYCHFLKLTGTRLSLDTCKTIKQDLAEKSIPWLLQKEQESVLETKMDRLTLTVLETEAKIQAHLQGIITDKLIVRAG